MRLRTLSIIALGCLTAFKARAAEPAAAEPVEQGNVIERLAGEAAVEELPQADGSTHYRSGVYRITTPLPEGYPQPTPPGVVEIKQYPEVRRATFEGKGRGPNGMENSAGGFWPLFGHIKSRGIAMTAPVEIEYEGLEPGDQDGIDGWSMSFLYRTKQNGPTESYANITVADAEPVTVISQGIAGDATRDKIDKSIGELHKMMDDADGWKTTGEVRVLGYNGPDVPADERWSEVQLIVEQHDSSS